MIKISDMETEINDLKNDLAEGKNIMNKNKNELEKLKREKGDLMKKYEQERRMTMETQSKIINIDNENRDLKKQMEGLKSGISDLKEKKEFSTSVMSGLIGSMGIGGMGMTKSGSGR